MNHALIRNLRRAAGLFVVAAAVASPALAGRNLVTNFDHRERLGVDLPMGWHLQTGDMMVSRCSIEPQTDGSLKFTVWGAPSVFYEQRDMTLVPGAKYRVSYEAKTAGLAGADVRAFLHDSAWNWNHRQQGPRLPDDTKGAWVRKEAVLTMCENAGATMHTLSVCCAHGPKDGQVVFFLRNLRLEAVDEATDRASAPIGKAARMKLPARLVPVNPRLADLNAADGKMTFYWPGAPACGRSNCRVVSRLRDKYYGKTHVSAPFDAKGYATIAYGGVHPTTYEVEAEVVDPATNTLAKYVYHMTFKRPTKPLTAGRRLNNFVTALVDQPLANGEVSFSRETQGWVWISFEGDVGKAAVGYLDDRAFPVVRYRDGENRIETQRFVGAGAHSLRIRGAKAGGRLRINAVKTIWGQTPSLTDHPVWAYRWGFAYTLPFFNRFDIHTAQNTSGFRSRDRQHADPVFTGYACERGLMMYAEGGASPQSPVYDDPEATWKMLASAAWQAGFPIAVDENDIVQYPRRTVNYTEAVWRMIYERPHQAVSLFYADANRGNYFACPETQVSEISATVNSGDGAGLICPEFYAAVKATPAELDKCLDCYAKFVSSAREMVPASRGSVVLYGASYVQLGDWSNYVEPSTDIKAHYATMYRAFATDPRFADCAGVGCGGQQCGGEELLRWVAKCVRYYALEGGTGDLAREAGFAWSPGFVKNPDMARGLTNWTVRGDIAAERLRGYGTRIQKRQAVGSGYGDGVATFTSHAAAPNELSQEIAGLTPGRLYGVLFAVIGRDAVASGKGTVNGPKEAPIGFSVRLEGATEYPDLRTEQFGAERQKMGLRTLRYVFRAEKPTARLVFVDRNDDGSAAPEGFRQALNYISFMPYYVESPAEPAEIAATLGWKGPNRIRNKR